MKVIEVQTEADRQRWDAFASGSRQACLYHDSRWREHLKGVYGLRTFYWMAEEEGQVKGILPVAVLRGLRGGRQAVSLPYHMYGGACAEGDGALQALLERAEAGLRDVDADSWELRQAAPLAVPYAPRTDKLTVLLGLPDRPETLWDALPAKTRNQVRKGEKAGLTSRPEDEGAIGDFYRVMVLNMRDLGSPVHSPDFFREAARLFPGQARIHRVFLGDRCVAAGITLDWRDRIELPWASCLREANPICANMYLYWQMIRSAIERGVRVFDFGRCTRDSGTHRFKLQWGGREEPLFYYYWRSTPPHTAPAGTSGRAFQVASQIWSHLPVAVTRVLGPRIVRRIP